jgi:hypothetical protein
MAPATEGITDIVSGKHPTSGEITTIPGAYPGNVNYTGFPSVGPPSIPPDQYAPSIDYFWIHNWKYLVPFPAPPVESRLTYQFGVYARNHIFWSGGEGMAMAFVSIGETGNLTTGTNIVPNVDGGWPLMHDLKQSAPAYNGHYGYIEGEVVVQRSFMVPGGRVPAIAIVVGAVAALSMMAQVRLFFADHCSISVGSNYMTGRLSYSYEPTLVNQA